MPRIQRKHNIARTHSDYYVDITTHVLTSFSCSLNNFFLSFAFYSHNVLTIWIFGCTLYCYIQTRTHAHRHTDTEVCWHGTQIMCANIVNTDLWLLCIECVEPHEKISLRGGVFVGWHVAVSIDAGGFRCYFLLLLLANFEWIWGEPILWFMIPSENPVFILVTLN